MRWDTVLCNFLVELLLLSLFLYLVSTLCCLASFNGESLCIEWHIQQTQCRQGTVDATQQPDPLLRWGHSVMNITLWIKAVPTQVNTAQHQMSWECQRRSGWPLKLRWRGLCSWSGLTLSRAYSSCHRSFTHWSPMVEKERFIRELSLGIYHTHKQAFSFACVLAY